MKRIWIYTLLLVGITALGHSGLKHSRDGGLLPKRDQEFANQLSIRQRKIFCGRFNQAQRDSALKYARGRGMDKCCTPDESVVKVMEETGMSLAVKRRKEAEISAQ